jgi:hypothetical protein
VGPGGRRADDSESVDAERDLEVLLPVHDVVTRLLVPEPDGERHGGVVPVRRQDDEDRPASCDAVAVLIARERLDRTVVPTHGERVDSNPTRDDITRDEQSRSTPAIWLTKRAH